MPRFFASNPIIAHEEIVISGQEARHMQRVLRLRVGDEVDIFDGTGWEYRSEIVRHDRLAVALRIREARKPGRESPLTVVMGQSLIRGQKMDFVVQKATEMGVSEVIPFVSSRSVASLDEGTMERRVERWKRIAVESSKQCGRVIPLRVDGVLGFGEALERASPGAERIILWERGTRTLKSLCQERNLIDGASRSVYFLVGPEGGFSEDEVRLAEKARFIPIGLGSRILRVETAGLSFASILQYEWGDLG